MRLFKQFASTLILLSSVELAPAIAQTAPRDIAINVIVPLTGTFAFIGKQEQVALQIGEQVVNHRGGIKGRPINFTFFDDQSNPQYAVQLTKQIIAKKPPILLGTSVTAGCNAMLALIADGPVTYCFSPGVHPSPGSYMFSSSLSTRDAIAALIRYARLRGWTKIALITSTDASGQDGEAGFDDAFKAPENKNMAVVARTRFNLTDLNVSAQIETMKAAQPNIIIAWTVGTTLSTVLKGLIQGGVDLPIATSPGNMTYAQMRQYADFLPKELYLPSPQWPAETGSISLDPAVVVAKKTFFDAMTNAHVEADSPTTLGWDPMMILVRALDAVGPDASASQVLAYIEHLKGFAGINGLYDFEKVPQRGFGEEGAVVAQWRADRKTWEIVSQPMGIPLP